MKTHETIRQLLALSAAGLLDAADDRRVREHVHECAECSTALDDLAAVAADLGRLPAPPVPADLLARTQARVAAEVAAQASSHRRHGAILAAVGAGLFAWMAALATWGLYRLLAGSAGWLAWLVLTTVPAYMAAGAVAAMFASRRRLERSVS